MTIMVSGTETAFLMVSKCRRYFDFPPSPDPSSRSETPNAELQSVWAESAPCASSNRSP
jgi:hypothetical protein